MRGAMALTRRLALAKASTQEARRVDRIEQIGLGRQRRTGDRRRQQLSAERRRRDAARAERATHEEPRCPRDEARLIEAGRSRPVESRDEALGDARRHAQQHGEPNIPDRAL